MPTLSTKSKVFITVLLFAVAVMGFMLKLPSVFRGHDRLMHALFYFVAAGFLNLFFNVRNLFIHLAIFALLYLFGVAIEYAQEHSNQYFQTRIHGRYDPEDIAWNLKGLLAFSGIWLLYTAIRFIFQKPGEMKAGTAVIATQKPVASPQQHQLADDAYFLFNCRATDLEQTALFYKTYFGFSEVTADSGQVQLIRGNLKILLQKRPTDSHAELHIQVRNIGALHANLSASKIAVDAPIYSSDNRLVQFRIEDPSGNRLLVSGL